MERGPAVGLPRSLSRYGRRLGRAHGTGAISVDSRSRQGAPVLHPLPGSLAIRHRFGPGTRRAGAGAAPRRARDLAARLAVSEHRPELPRSRARCAGARLRTAQERRQKNIQLQRPALVRQPLGCCRAAIGDGVEMSQWLNSCSIFVLAAAVAACASPASASAQAGSASRGRSQALGSIGGTALTVSVYADGTYSIAAPGIAGPVVRSD